MTSLARHGPPTANQQCKNYQKRPVAAEYFSRGCLPNANIKVQKGVAFQMDFRQALVARLGLSSQSTLVCCACCTPQVVNVKAAETSVSCVVWYRGVFFLGPGPGGGAYTARRLALKARFEWKQQIQVVVSILPMPIVWFECRQSSQRNTLAPFDGTCLQRCVETCSLGWVGC
jgi:hypothetical protein